MDVTFFLILVVSFLVLLAIPVVIAVLRVAGRWSIEKRSALARAEARVVDKRTELAGGGPADQRYYVTFEFATGQRLELDLPGRESGMLVVGDQGTLAWQGPRSSASRARCFADAGSPQVARKRLAKSRFQAETGRHGNADEATAVECQRHPATSSHPEVDPRGRW